MNFYNEHDPRAAAWLRELIRHEHIPAGIVDERSIEDIRPDELRGFTQCHFFAGIGGWSLALRLAGWPEDRPVWTGSCPCQPFSSAGKGAGFTDERHLWPAFHHLIRVCRPAIVVGEQVASPDGLRWCDLVQDDLEMEGYSFGKADLCAAGVGAPHIRQRLYWAGRLGIPNSPGWQQGQPPSPPMGHGSPTEPAGSACGMAHSVIQGLEGHSGHGDDGDQPGRVGENEAGPVAKGGTVGGVADATHVGRREERPHAGRGAGGDRAQGQLAGLGAGSGDLWTSPLRGFWRDADWLFCRDGKWRPVEPGTFPLADGLPARVVRLRGYGNAIVPQVGAEFIKAYLEATNR